MEYRRQRQPANRHRGTSLLQSHVDWSSYGDCRYRDTEYPKAYSWRSHCAALPLDDFAAGRMVDESAPNAKDSAVNGSTVEVPACAFRQDLAVFRNLRG